MFKNLNVMKTTEKTYIGTYKLVRFHKNSNRREVLERGLTFDQARRATQNYPSTRCTFVGFMKQFTSSKYYK